jgi:hypothetical protein
LNENDNASEADLFVMEFIIFYTIFFFDTENFASGTNVIQMSCKVKDQQTKIGFQMRCSFVEFIGKDGLKAQYVSNSMVELRPLHFAFRKELRTHLELFLSIFTFPMPIHLL